MLPLGFSGLFALATVLPPTLVVAPSPQRQAVKQKHVRVCGQPLRGHKAGVTCADYRPGGQRIVTAVAAGRLKLWLASNGKLKNAIASHQGDVHVVPFYEAGPSSVAFANCRRSSKAACNASAGNARQTVRTRSAGWPTARR